MNRRLWGVGVIAGTVIITARQNEISQALQVSMMHTLSCVCECMMSERWSQVEVKKEKTQTLQLYVDRAEWLSECPELNFKYSESQLH